MGKEESTARQPGASRRTRIEDVAAHVGLSPASVSLVLRNAPGPSAATRERVLQAAADLGYRADRTASLLARRRRHLLGLLIDISNSFHAELVAEIHEAAEQRGYDLVLSTVTKTRDEQRAVETLLDFRCEALVLLGPTMATARLAVLSRQLPVIVVGRRIGKTGPDVVRTSDDQGVGLAVDHLAQLGHRAIVFVDGGKGMIASDRRRGYTRAMRRHGLDDLTQVFAGGHTEEAGMHVAGQIIDRADVPTAVITSNDRCAVGLLDALNRARIDVPDRLSVVGYDDSPLARLAHVGLTTISQNPRQLAEHAVTAAVERLDEHRMDPSSVVLTPRIVVRRTSGPCRESG